MGCGAGRGPSQWPRGKGRHLEEEGVPDGGLACVAIPHSVSGLAAVDAQAGGWVQLRGCGMVVEAPEVDVEGGLPSRSLRRAGGGSFLVTAGTGTQELL